MKGGIKMKNLEKQLRILIAIASANVDLLLEQDNVTVKDLDDAFFVEQSYRFQLDRIQNGLPIDMANIG
jgi:hypothetical protein